MCQQCEKPVVDQAGQRQGHTQGFGSGEDQAIVFESQGSRETGGLEFLVGDQSTVGLVIQRNPRPWLVSEDLDWPE